MNPVLVILSVSGATIGLSVRAVEPMLPAIAAQFSVSMPEAAQIITGFAVVYALGQFLVAPLSERFGKLAVITVSMFLGGLLLLASSTAASLFGLGLWRAAVAFAACAPFVLGMAYIGDTVPIEQRQTAVAHYVIGNVIGHAFGPLVAGGVADWIGWRATFVLHGTLFMVVGLVLWWVTRRHWQGERRTGGAFHPIAPFLEVWKLPGARMVAISALFEAFFFFGAFAYVGALLKDRFDLSLTIIGVALAGFGLGGLIFNLCIRWFVRHMRPRGQLLGGGLLCGSMYIAVAVLPWWQPALACMVGVGLGFYMVHNVLQTRGTEAAPQARGVGLALFGITWSVGQGLGIAAMGAASTLFGFAPMIAICGVGFALLSLWMRANYHRLP